MVRLRRSLRRLTVVARAFRLRHSAPLKRGAPFSVPSYLIKKIKNFKKTVDISGICAILFSVMRNMTFDDLSCEEVFELNAVCDEWQNDAIEAQDADDEWVKSIWGCGVLFKKSEWERQSS